MLFEDFEWLWLKERRDEREHRDPSDDQLVVVVDVTLVDDVDVAISERRLMMEMRSASKRYFWWSK